MLILENLCNLLRFVVLNASYASEDYFWSQSKFRKGNMQFSNLKEHKLYTIYNMHK